MLLFRHNSVLFAVSNVRKEFFDVVKSDRPSSVPDVGLFSIITSLEEGVFLMKGSSVGS